MSRTAACFFKGCTADAPYRLGFPGFPRDQPAAVRGKGLWHCAEHEDLAWERRAQKARELNFLLPERRRAKEAAA